MPSSSRHTQGCSGCAWSRGTGSSCAFHALGDEPIAVDGTGCDAWEAVPNCLDCGACCREAFDSVPVELAAQQRLPDELIRRHDDGWVDLQRVPSPLGCGTRCAALRGGPPYTCVVYALRPDNCRDLEAGSEACLMARRRVGLTEWAEGQTPEGPLFRGA